MNFGMNLLTNPDSVPFTGDSGITLYVMIGLGAAAALFALFAVLRRR